MIPTARVKKIIALANEVNTLFDKSSSLKTLREKISVLAVELNHAELLPKSMDVDYAVNLMINSRSRLKKCESLKKNQKLMSGDNGDLENWFCSVFGISKNRTISWNEGRYTGLWLSLWPLFFLILLTRNIKLLEAIMRISETLLFYSFYYTNRHRPKILMPLGMWVADGKASVVTRGLNGTKTLNNEEYGLYVLHLIGFIGIMIHFGKKGGFISGFSLYSDMYLFPDETS